jgi:ferredoxin
MTERLTVHYFPRRCIGQGNCCALAPEHFQMSGSKAVLKNSKVLDEDVQVVEFQGDEEHAERIINAGLACPANAIRVYDPEQDVDIVSVHLEQKTAKEVTARYDDATEFVLDPAGYFLIRIDRKNQNIEVGFCNERNKIMLKVVGKKPIDIYTTILNKESLPIRKDHAAYLGRELQKAYLALQWNLVYVQDDDLDQRPKMIDE